MKTPLPEDDEIICDMLLEHWNVHVTNIHFIPIGESAYSYKIETENISYYLKIIDRQTASGHRTAAHMEFSLSLQRFIGEHPSSAILVPIPQQTTQGLLYASYASLLFALYTLIGGTTLGDAYPMSAALVRRIGETLAALHRVQIPATLQQKAPLDNLMASFDEGLLADLAAIEGISTQDALHLQRLREIVSPWREYIRAFLMRSREYREKAQQIPNPLVVCHGDAWGGNIIPSPSGKLVLIDWESSVMAPPERDVFIYIGYNNDDFTAFDTGYRTVHKEPMC
ncbi:MAG: hypothetical protein NVS4B11_36480 [Ktedonobacteraceae bacterium]